MRMAVLMATTAHEGWDQHVPSLLAQTVPADVILVVVDRECGEVERAALKGKWPSVEFLFNPANLGLTASLNVGLDRLAELEADIVFRADDDDHSMPQRFEKQLACFDETGADLVAAWVESENAQGGRFTEKCPSAHDEIVRALTTHRNVLVHPTLAFRREAIGRIGNYDTTFVNAQDYALYLAAVRAGLRFAAVAEPLVRRHYYAGNITVRRRMNQMMYSCAARCVHHAATGDRGAFLRALRQYALLAATPMWARSLRRSLRGMMRRGVKAERGHDE